MFNFKNKCRSAKFYASQMSKHLIVLVHGYFGSTFGMRSLEAALQSHDTLVHVATFPDEKQFSLFTTADGIEAGGKRLAAEIRQVVSQNSLSKISLVGVSLGGIYCRWVAHELADLRANTIAGLKPHIFISVVSPHLGVVHSLGSFYQTAASAMSYMGERTSGQLLGFDEFAQMQQLTTPPFLAAWSLFERRFLFSNLLNDNRVDYCSGAILRAPQESLQDEDALRDLNREVVGVYDIADYQGGREYPAYESGALLNEKQLAMLNAIRESDLRFTNVDLRLNKNLFSRFFAHVIPLGIFSRWGAQGDESMRTIARYLLH